MKHGGFMFAMMAAMASMKGHIGFGRSYAEGFAPPPPKKISRKTFVKMSNHKKPKGAR